VNYKHLSRNVISSGAYWQVNKQIARLTDNDTAILLADLISKESYFEGKGQLNNGFFFNTVENIQEDTNIKKDKQLKCLKKLENIGFITVKIFGIPRKRNFKINHEIIFNALGNGDYSSEMPTTDELENRRLVSGNIDDCSSEKSTTINKNKDNKNKINNNKVNNKQIIDTETFFNTAWELYPNKKGKGSIKQTQKNKIYKLGDEFLRCIERYKKDIKINNTEKRYIKHGSTFFNSGYVDYLDENYTKLPEPIDRKPTYKQTINMG
jgi:hypothetical protein